MKFVHPDLSHSLMTPDANFTEWVIESPKYFLKYVDELSRQENGEEGKFTLSEESKELNISKNINVILDIFSIDINEKKYLNKLYTELNELAYSEEFYVQTQETIQAIQKYILDMEYKSGYILEISDSINLVDLFKAAGVRHEIFENDVVEKILRYIKTTIHIMGIKLFVFVNLRSYLSDEQFEALIKDLSYQETHVLFIENCAKACVKGVFRYIIDKDGCEIY